MSSSRARIRPFVLVVGFLGAIHVTLLSPLLPAIVRPLGGGAFAIGLLVSLYSLARFLTEPTYGALEDRYGRRPVQLVSMVGLSVGFAILTLGAWSQVGLWVLFLGWIVVGLFDCWLTTCFATVADSTTPAERTRYFAYLTAAIGASFAVGPAASGVLAASDPTTPLLAMLAVLVAATAWGWFSMPETLPVGRRATHLEHRRLDPLSQLRTIVSVPHLRLLLSSLFLFYPGVIALASSLPTLLAERAGWSTAGIAFALTIWGCVFVVMQLAVIPSALRHVREIHMAIAGGTLGVVAFVLLALFATIGTTVLVYAALLLVGGAHPLVQTCLTGAMSRSMAADVQGRVLGAVSATTALAQVVGPVVVGALYVAVSPAAPYWVLAASVATSVALMLRSLPRLERTSEPDPSSSTPEGVP